MFKVGDRVINKNRIGTLVDNNRCVAIPRHIFCIDYDNGAKDCIINENEINLIQENKSNKKFMSNIIEKARLLIKGEPEKSLIAKGITDINDILTEEGRQLFQDFLYRANKAAFVADSAVAALLSEKDDK
jgi:hypothetical protein